MRTSIVLIPFFFAALAANADVVRCTDANGKISYTDGKCPSDTRQSRQVAIDDSPPPPVPMPPPPPEQPREPRQPAYTPPPPAAPSGPAVIPRSPVAEGPAAEPPVYILGPEPYYEGRRPGYRQPLRDPGPPPGQRPCQNLAGIKRNNC